MKGKLLIYICTLSIFGGCATGQKSRLMLMGAALPIGAGVGAATAPSDERPDFHALTWGATFVALSALFGNYYFSNEEELKKLRQENSFLKNKPKFKLITKGKGVFKTPFSQKGQKEVQWKVYKIDQWIPDGENRKIHQDLIIEKIPQKDHGK